ncbi:Succinate dehydrogenase cytochrome b556 subunit [Candidatus Xenohaliotis californiensis]|uniref:Succinate dehydrogenase cytochrome b556 subunit n=1 Tax=Candidatus Xenohaliotis californiensis TaxID=84677 RepID=A0ABM9N7T5_9RICK|nr:Succinate dehydrogenase cytochrome b556 subunit [Candidatus Xenohaliotis californiensis]
MSNNFRPMSPHMGIYKFPFAGLLSGAHRITGALAYLYLLCTSWLLIFSHYCKQVPKLITFFGTGNIGFILMSLFLVAAFYHTFNGIKYLLWITGKAHSVKAVNSIGILTILLTIITSILYIILLKKL